MNPRPYFLFTAVVLFLAALVGCAQTTKISRNEVLKQNDAIATLQSDLDQAEQEGIDYLAPVGFRESKSLLDRAFEQAQVQNTGAAQTSASNGMKRLTKARKDAETSREVLREALAARKRALKANAPKLQAAQYQKLERELQKATERVERGDIEQAKRYRPDLINGYTALELDALKKNSVEVAQNSIAEAKRQEADDYAPKTFKQAQDELNVAITVLDTDRTQTEKADAHAQRAHWLASRSQEITELAKDFRRRDFSVEDTLLWYQEQLSIINEPFGKPLPFNQPNYEVVAELKKKTSETVADLEDAKMQLANAEQSQQGLREQMLSTEVASREAEARYTEIQALFDESEAEVYRKGQDVLLVTHSFNFPVGKSEIQTENFNLMRKIIESIKIFDAPKVTVSGHTDSTGTKENNQALSLKRAENVAAFLHEVGGIPSEQISAQGLGESRPLANNNTAEGRARNRRIEVLIINN